MIKVDTREEFLIAVRGFLPQYPRCIELGVFNGDFSKMIHSVLNPVQLFLVDPFAVGGKTYGKELGNLQVEYSTEEQLKAVELWQKLFFNVTIIRKRSHEALYLFNENTFHFVYIDASHLYEDVKRDLIEYAPKVKGKGIIAGHDYIEYPSFGVKQAVNEFCEENNYKFVILNKNGGDFALMKK